MQGRQDAAPARSRRRPGPAEPASRRPRAGPPGAGRSETPRPRGRRRTGRGWRRSRGRGARPLQLGDLVGVVGQRPVRPGGDPGPGQDQGQRKTAGELDQATGGRLVLRRDLATEHDPSVGRAERWQLDDPGRVRQLEPSTTGHQHPGPRTLVEAGASRAARGRRRHRAAAPPAAERVARRSGHRGRPEQSRPRPRTGVPSRSSRASVTVDGLGHRVGRRRRSAGPVVRCRPGPSAAARRLPRPPGPTCRHRASR